ncbi:HTH-type transcriptional regulator CueR [Zhongshania aliphaticivorans]|uniref:HTH-type transcriptional regulator CueR n=1 Tax=Zhongshania aliphaticivorans TaxID=1470434 RepID=A0A5S9PIE7_9GAMM|nr:MerR family transcriptional regulator [Zhongshania aliphaticivorans]CAA0103541.1 HTH-type transcriptional regulator CueR [Zhongshania aliphaticivorans]CAA0113440.1 HTH-type transcriptional regulator CueR [Zhongshania aliphaticivorans]
MYIKEVAGLTGASRKAIYLYEEMGLLPAISRDENKYRAYTLHHVKLIRLIKRAQELGFKLAEIVPIIEEKQASHQFPTELVIDKIKLKRASIESEIAALNERFRGLGELMHEVSITDF